MAVKLLNLTQAAKELGVTRRAIRKHFERAPELNRGTDHRPQVNLRQLKKWRAQHVNPAKRNGDASHLADQPEGGAITIPDSIPDDTNFADARRMRELIKLRTEKARFDKEFGELVSMSDALEIVLGAARHLREKFPARWRRVAAEVRTAKSSADVVRLLQAQTDQVLQELTDEFGQEE